MPLPYRREVSCLSGKKKRFLHPDEVSRRRTSPVGCSKLRYALCSTWISRLNWNSVAAPRLASESVWLFSDPGTHLKPHRRILDFNLRTSCRYSAIRASLATYSLLTWLTISEESQRTSSLVTSSVIVTQSPAMTASYSASLLDVGRPRIKDCSMIEPSGVTTILMPFPLTV